MSKPTLLALAIPALAVTLAGQGSVAAPPAPEPGDLRIPIHRAVHDAQSPDASLWAGGDTYKVAFGDGFTFYPVLGSAAPRNLPMRWRTASVTVGGRAVTDLAAREARHSEWRYELVADGLIEAYDVNGAGVEQTFVLTGPPRGQGDFVVVGAIETELRCADRPARHAAIELRDAEDRTVIGYGAATVFDATGRRLAVTSAFERNRITLTVPGAWLAEAVYPVTLDPLTSTTQLANAAGNTATSSTAIGTEADSGSANVMVVFTRAVSASDHDVYAMLMNADWSNRRNVHSDLTNVNSDFDAQVAYVAGADRWLIGTQRDYSARSGRVTSTIRVYYHDRANLGLNTGTAFSIQNIGTEEFSRPALGGTSTGTGAWGVLVYQRDLAHANTPNSDVVVVPIRATTAQFWSAYIAGDNPVGTTLDREDPAVTPVSDGGSDGWLVAWSEITRGSLTDDWDIHAVRTDAAGGRVGSSALLASAGTRHSRRPRLAGRSESYMLVHEETSNVATSSAAAIVARRVDWSVRTATPSLGPVRTIVSTASSLLGPLSLEGLADDSRTRSHWAVTYTQARVGGRLSTRAAHIARLGGTGGVTETATLFTSSTRSASAAHVAYDSRQSRFAAVYAILSSSAPFHPVYGAHFDYPITARAVPYGRGCGTARISSSPPYVGNRHFTVLLGRAPGSVPATLFVSFGPGALVLDRFGLTGCSLLIDPTSMLLGAPAVTSTRGTAAVELPLPDVPPFAGDLFVQWVYTARGANPASLLLTGGLRAEVR